MTPRILLHLEGAAVCVLSLFVFHWTHGSWLQFAVLFLAPDLSMAGYLANPRLGSITYNTVHTYLGPLALGGYSLAASHPEMLAISLIWIAHIGFDRMLGYGLKYPTQFKDTHLNRL
jgi:hypothetical protein